MVKKNVITMAQTFELESDQHLRTFDVDSWGQTKRLELYQLSYGRMIGVMNLRTYDRLDVRRELDARQRKKTFGQ